jgi:hypothetical protein
MRNTAWWFPAWIVVGAAYGLGLLAVLSFGVVALAIAVAATLVLVFRYRAVAAWPGLIVGAALPVLYVAFLNRSGPGTVCTVDAAGGQACVDRSNPWLWLLAAVVLIAAGSATQIILRRRARVAA